MSDLLCDLNDRWALAGRVIPTHFIATPLLTKVLYYLANRVAVHFQRNIQLGGDLHK